MSLYFLPAYIDKIMLKAALLSSRDNVSKLSEQLSKQLFPRVDIARQWKLHNLGHHRHDH